MSMEMNFTPGQKVICVMGSGYLIVGKVYTINRVFSDGDDSFVKLNELMETNPGHDFFEKRFICAEKYLSEQKFNKKFEDFLSSEGENNE